MTWACEALKDSALRPACHHRLLLSELEQLSSGQYDRLMILMPPGSAKSTYASVIFPSWWFAQHPCSSVIAASHSFSLAEHFSRRTQALINAKQTYLGVTILPTQRSAASWTTSNGGEYVAVGVRGAIAGRRADLVIIDDPIKSQADAESIRHRNHLWDWYRSDITTRLKPNGKVVLIMTRWHPEDLGGQLLDQEATNWKIVRLPALAEANDPLGRPVGSALWPEWENRSALVRKRELIGERVWSALYQQTPLPSGGRLFSAERINMIESLDSFNLNTTVRAWDLAATGESGQNDPDWTVGVKLARDEIGRYIISDVVRLRGSPHQVEGLIVQTAHKDGINVIISIPEDPGQAGKSQISYLVRQLSGFHVVSSRETGAKATRAMPLASQVEAGNILVLRRDWTPILVSELRDFPWGKKDDQVDALVRAFTTLTARPRMIPLRPINILDR